MTDIENIMDTMGELNEVLHVAFNDIMDINLKDDRLKIVLWNGVEYFFYKDDGKWAYDGYGVRVD